MVGRQFLQQNKTNLGEIRTQIRGEESWRELEKERGAESIYLFFYIGPLRKIFL
jgi:hypothetical protein